MGMVLSTAVAGPLREVELADGSILRGEVVGGDGSTFTLRSPTLGELRIPAADVVAIRAPGTGAAAPAPSPPGLEPESPTLNPVQVLDLQRQIAEDEEAMGLIQGLRDDPAVTAVLNDPALMNALLRGDVEVLRDHPKLRTLMDHPTVKRLVERYR